jgi:hypothetical protein
LYILFALVILGSIGMFSVSYWIVRMQMARRRKEAAEEMNRLRR